MKEIVIKVKALLLAPINDPDVIAEVVVSVVRDGLRLQGWRPPKGGAQGSNAGNHNIEFDDPSRSNSEIAIIEFDDPIGGDNGGGSGSALSLFPSGPSEQISKKSELDGLPPAFVRFWAAYPSKVGKAAALRAWRRKRPPLEACLRALEWQRRSLKWQQGYIPNPATWINGGRWEDEPPTDLRSNGLTEKEIRSGNALTKWVNGGGE